MADRCACGEEPSGGGYGGDGEVVQGQGPQREGLGGWSGIYELPCLLAWGGEKKEKGRMPRSWVEFIGAMGAVTKRLVEAESRSKDQAPKKFDPGIKELEGA